VTDALRTGTLYCQGITTKPAYALLGKRRNSPGRTRRKDEIEDDGGKDGGTRPRESNRWTGLNRIETTLDIGGRRQKLENTHQPAEGEVSPANPLGSAAVMHGTFGALGTAARKTKHWSRNEAPIEMGKINRSRTSIAVGGNWFRQLKRPRTVKNSRSRKMK